jgi:hypothetical protein
MAAPSYGLIGRSLIKALALAVLLAAALLAYTAEAQVEPANITLNMTDYKKVYSFAGTTVSYILENGTLTVSYVCLYGESIEEDCAALLVYAQPEGRAEQLLINASDPAALPRPVDGVVAALASLDVGESNVTLKVVNATDSSVLAEVEIQNPGLLLVPPDVQNLVTLIPVGIVAGFALRGSVKETGIGMILAGTAVILLSLIGLGGHHAYSVAAMLYVGGFALLFLLS